MFNLFKKKRKPTLFLNMKVISDPEDPAVFWLELPDNLRLIYRDGEYVGHYSPTLPEPLG